MLYSGRIITLLHLCHLPGFGNTVVHTNQSLPGKGETGCLQLIMVFRSLLPRKTKRDVKQCNTFSSRYLRLSACAFIASHTSTEAELISEN